MKQVRCLEIDVVAGLESRPTVRFEADETYRTSKSPMFLAIARWWLPACGMLLRGAREGDTMMASNKMSNESKRPAVKNLAPMDETKVKAGDARRAAVSRITSPRKAGGSAGFYRTQRLSRGVQRLAPLPLAARRGADGRQAWSPVGFGLRPGWEGSSSSTSSRSLGVVFDGRPLPESVGSCQSSRFASSSVSDRGRVAADESYEAPSVDVSNDRACAARPTSCCSRFATRSDSSRNMSRLTCSA